MDEQVEILHVDDNANIGDLVATYLERSDDRISVSTETNVSDALEALGGTTPDVDCIVSDYDMPDMGGIDFLEAVRKRHPDLPFILFTGKGSEEIASEAISAGVTDYLQKGTNTEQYTVLSNRVLNAVDHHRVEVQLHRKDSLQSTLFDALPVGVLAEDGNRTVIAVNERYTDLFDIDEGPSSILGTDAQDIVQSVSDRIVEPADFVERTTALIDDPEPVRNERLRFESGRQLSRTHVPFELRDGIGYLWVYDEVTERTDDA